MSATAATSALALLRAHLDQRASHGTKLVALSKDARLALRSLIQFPPSRRATHPATPLATSNPEVRTVADASATPAAVFAQAFAPAARSAPPASPVAAELAPPAPLESLVLEVPGTTLEAQLAALAAMAAADPRPHALRSLGQTLVFATGTPRSSIMFVGDAPGSEEEQLHEPFVGPAGQLLTKIIAAMGLQRPDVYLTNVCKFRPLGSSSTSSSDRPTSVEELRACQPYIATEIALIKPQVIIALGASAATGLGIEGPIGKNRGHFHSVCGSQVMVTYHPSYLLREALREGGPKGGMKVKRLLWEDMLAVMQTVGLSISDQQRGYFRSAG